jgi:hypothetical protein
MPKFTVSIAMEIVADDAVKIADSLLGIFKSKRQQQLRLQPKT